MPSEDAKAMKKEEVEDEDEINLGSLRKKKPNIGTPKEVKAKKVKKEEADEDFEQTSTKKTSTKPSDKKKKKKEEDEKKKKKKGAKQPEKIAMKRERKVYDLPGQKRDSPEERDPVRIFYETLYKQVPNSEMAAIWMMESGLLAKDVAKKVFEKKQKKAQQLKLKTPMKAVVTVKKKTQSVTIKKKTSSSPISTQKKKTQSVTIKKKTSSSPISTQKKKTPDSKVPSKQSKKRKMADSSSDEASDDDDDFVLESKRAKKQRAT